MAPVEQSVASGDTRGTEAEARLRVAAALVTTGSGPIASEVLRCLREQCDLRCVVFSQAPRKTTRWQRVREYGLWYSVQFIYSRLRGMLSGTRIRREVLDAWGVEQSDWTSPDQEGDIVALLKRQGVSLVVVCGLQFKVSDAFIKACDVCVNVHPSLLPEYRGPEPVVWGLLDRAQHFGVTLHHMDAGFDTGDVVAQAQVDGRGVRSVYEVEKRLSERVPGLIEGLVAGYRQGDVPRTPQTGGEYLSRPTLERRRTRREAGQQAK